jgi:plastocyanin
MKWLPFILLLASCGTAPKSSLTGKAIWPAAQGEPRRLDMNADEDCMKLHARPAAEVLDEYGLIYVKDFPAGSASPADPAPAAKPVIDQKGCLFAPRIVAVRTGQPIAVRNSDPVSHSIHPMPKNNREWNQQQTPGAPDLERKFGFAETIIPVKCNIHAWMKSYIAVFAHPHFAVVPRGGTYRFSSLPDGDYTIALWLESRGEITRRVRVQGAATLDVAIPE